MFPSMKASKEVKICQNSQLKCSVKNERETRKEKMNISTEISKQLKVNC